MVDYVITREMCDMRFVIWTVISHCHIKQQITAVGSYGCVMPVGIQHLLQPDCYTSFSPYVRAICTMSGKHWIYFRSVVVDKGLEERLSCQLEVHVCSLTINRLPYQKLGLVVDELSEVKSSGFIH